MTSIYLYPSLEQCIETTTRKAYLDLQRQALDSGDIKEETTAKLLLLEKFLAGADFRKLRAQSEELLLEGKKVKFVILEESGEMRWTMQAIKPLRNSQQAS